MTSRLPSQCLYCVRWLPPVATGGSGVAQTCEAYPYGIPDAIWANEVDHREMQAGDSGLTWAGSDFPDWAMATAGSPLARASVVGQADGLVALLQRAAGVVDHLGNLHSPAGTPVGGRFIGKALDALTPDSAPRRMTDAEFEARREKIERAISEHYSTRATQITHSQDGVWEAGRDAVHREIAASLYDKAASVPRGGKAVLSGGLGGAGKSTVLRDYAGIDPDQYLTINADDAKEELAARGLVPEVPGHEDLSPMERATLIHAESQRIAGLLADMAYRDRRNIIWDTTMGSETWTSEEMAKMRREFGYDDVRAVFVDIPVEVSVERALDRWRRGQEEFAAGLPSLGGRYVPPSYILGQRTPSGSTVPREAFDQLRHQFDAWSLFDNSVFGQAPRLVAESGGTVRERSWRRLLTSSTG